MLDYAKKVSPKMAFDNNNENGRKHIKKEAIKEVQFLKDVSIVFGIAEMNEEKNQTIDDAVFLAKWILDFEKYERR